MNKPVIAGVVAVVLLLVGAPLLVKALSGPPPLNEASLTGTRWEVDMERGKFKVELFSGGRLVATVPPELLSSLQILGISGIPETVEGNWSVKEGKVEVTASLTVAGQTHTQSALCEIRGQKLFHNDKEIVRLP